MCPHIMTMQPSSEQGESQGEQSSGPVPPDYLDGALVTAGAAAAENSPQTAAGASAPLSRPALVTAPRDEEGPLLSEADPTSNAG